MIKIVREQENYLLVSDGLRFTVVERRNGRFYGVRNCARRSAIFDDAGFAALVREAGSYTLYQGSARPGIGKRNGRPRSMPSRCIVGDKRLALSESHWLRFADRYAGRH